MKNNYKFKYLTKRSLSVNEDEPSIFFAMYKLFMHGDMTKLLSISELEEVLDKHEYYVANKLVTHKGKKIIFKGIVVRANQQDLIAFLRNATAKNDIRPMLIAPLFANGDPSQAIYVSEDECYLREKSNQFTLD